MRPEPKALPPLPVVDEPRDQEAPETKVLATQALSTLVPEILITPKQAVVRGWGCEDDHFEVRSKCLYQFAFGKGETVGQGEPLTLNSEHPTRCVGGRPFQKISRYCRVMGKKLILDPCKVTS